MLVHDTNRAQPHLIVTGSGGRGLATLSRLAPPPRPMYSSTTCEPSPSAVRWPPSSRMTRGQAAGPTACCARRTAPSGPSRSSSSILPEALLLEFGVTDGQHLVDEQDLGLEVGGDREREAHVHAARVALDRRIEEPLDARRTRRSRRTASSTSARLIPMIAADEQDVLPAGQLRVEAGADLQQRADPAARSRRDPIVGGVMRARILSIVLLPAPLRPMMPTVSPALDLERDVLQRPEVPRRPLGLAAARGARGRRCLRAASDTGRRPGSPRCGSACRCSRPGSRSQMTSAKKCSTRRK